METIWSKAIDWNLNSTITNAIEILKTKGNHSQNKIDAIISELSKVPVYINYRAASRYGVYKTEYGVKSIELSSILFRNGLEHDRNDTFLHEVAHHLACRFYGYNEGFISADSVGYASAGHGPYWKLVMRALGQKPERCGAMHSEEAKEALDNMRVNHIYECMGCKYQIKTVRRWKNPERKYHPECRKQGKPDRFKILR